MSTHEGGKKLIGKNLAWHRLQTPFVANIAKFNKYRLTVVPLRSHRSSWLLAAIDRGETEASDKVRSVDENSPIRSNPV